MLNLVKEIKKLIKLQIALMATFRLQFSDRKDWVFLLDFPKKGSLQIDNDTWHFQKHGAGISFKRNRDGVIVDIHRKLDDHKCFDAWRLEQYLESLGFDLEERNEIEDDLIKLAFAGIIHQHPDNNRVFFFPTPQEDEAASSPPETIFRPVKPGQHFIFLKRNKKNEYTSR